MDWSSIRLVTTTSTPLVASFALTACFAPCSTSGCIFEAVRFHTVKSKPAFNMHWAMFEPMLPKPMNATFMMSPVATDHVTFYCAMRGTKTQQKPRSSNRAFACGARHCSRVRFWHKADILSCTAHVRFRG